MKVTGSRRRAVPDQNWLKLIGLVRAEEGVLRVRNEIYRQVFNLEWIKANASIDWTRRIAVLTTLITLILMWQSASLSGSRDGAPERN